MTVIFSFARSLIRQIGSSYYGGASLGEALYAISSMKQETPTEWVNVFLAQAKRLQQDAHERKTKGHFQSAYEQFLKTANAYRACEYYTRIDDERHAEFGLQSRAAFIEAISFCKYGFKSEFVEYKGLKLPYYFLTPTKEQTKRKTIIIVSGYDGTLEESFLQSGIAALERNYNILLFAGPGQMDSVRFNKTYFEPDYENAVKGLLDIVLSEPAIDMAKIALYGISFGGYFALRAGVSEKRISALILNSPIVNLHNYLVGFIGYDPAIISDSDDFTLSDIPSISDEECPPNTKEMLYNLMFRFGNQSFKQTFEYLNKFIVSTKVIQTLTKPSLALVGKGEGDEPIKQYLHFCNNAPMSSKYEFTQAEGADSHCQLGNLNFSNCVIYDWLDDIF